MADDFEGWDEREEQERREREKPKLEDFTDADNERMPDPRKSNGIDWDNDREGDFTEHEPDEGGALKTIELRPNGSDDERGGLKFLRSYDKQARALLEATWFAGVDDGPAPLFDPWERYIVPEFPLWALQSPVLRDYVKSQSVVIGCDQSAMAMATLTAVSGAIDHRSAVKMLRHGNWYEHPRLWTLLVGDPSCKKTPIVNEVTRPLEQHQTSLRRVYERALADYRAAKERGDNTMDEPDPPKRFVVWDSTIEKLGEILSRSDKGLLVKSDEVAGWLGRMEKYGGRGAGADRAFWLQAYDGGSHAIDRVSRGETYIGNLSVSLIGGIQPSRLAELRGLTSDGLLQRFVPVMMRSSSFAQDCDTSQDQLNYRGLINKLIAARYQTFDLDDQALEMMNDLRRQLHEREQVASGLTDGLQGFIGKLPGIAGRLAVILHMANHPENTPHEIHAATLGAVTTIIKDFILRHAVEFYRQGEELTDGERLRKIASWILTGKQKVITSRDFIQQVRCLRGVSVWDLNEHLSPLVAAGWLEPTVQGPLNREWTACSTVAVQFERQRQIEEERKACIAALMGSPRRPAER
jgi:hypothetical protein